MKMKDKAVLITGSTSGIGLGIAHALAAEGCNLVLNGFGDSDKISTLLGEFRDRYAIDAIHHPADLTKPREIEELMETAKDKFDGVDILLNNAGIQHVAPLETFPTEAWDQIIAVNLTAAFHTTRLAVPMMRRKGWGRIINTGSVHSLIASVNKSAYTAAKHGIAGLTKATALEVAGQGITCNGFAPGWTRTPLVEKQIAAHAEKLGVPHEVGARELLKERQPSQQFVEIGQLAQLIIFLCSDAASQITGSIITMDGGWTAQ
jgi:3-hydroxybutyrate dehydrogenase